MTIEEAIFMIEDHMRVHRMGEFPHIFVANALNMAISALRAQQEAEKNELCGLFGKYIVRKNATGELVENCFVLRPDKDVAAVAALRAYAGATDNRALAADIISWVGAEKNDPLTWDELVSMRGKPVWVVEDWQYWAIVGETFKPGVDLFVSLIRDGDPDDCGGRSRYGAGLDWLAYRRPPTEKGECHGTY